jgi:hypothetical protein
MVKEEDLLGVALVVEEVKVRDEARKLWKEEVFGFVWMDDLKLCERPERSRVWVAVA